MAEGAHYRFEPLQRRGILLGLGFGQLTVLAAALVVALALVKTWPGLAGGAGALAALGVGGLLCRPVAGRTPLRWANIAASFAARRSSTTAPVPGQVPGFAPVPGPFLLPGVAPAPGVGRAVPGTVGPGAAGSARPDPARPDPARPDPARPYRAWPHRAPTPARRPPPRCFVPGLYLSEISAEDGGGAMGVLVDEREGTAAAIVRAQGSSFCLLDDNGKERRLAAWAAVLESLSNQRSTLVRLQWCQRALSGDGHALISHLRRAGDPTSPGYAGHMALLESAGPRSRRHETLLVVAVRARCRHRRPTPEGAAALRNEVRALRAQMRNVGLVCEGVLDERGAAAALGGFLLPDLVRHPGAHPWPLAVEEHWADVHADLSWHRTYWVAEWPRSRVGADFLSPLLVGMGRRSFSVLMAPVPPERALRDAESSRTAQLADAQLRAQGGFLETAQQRRQAEAVEGRETELADGRGSFQLAGYVSVSADDKPGLEEACAELERAAGGAKLCLRALFGQQKEALTWALPFGRGL